MRLNGSVGLRTASRSQVRRQSAEFARDRDGHRVQARASARRSDPPVPEGRTEQLSGLHHAIDLAGQFDSVGVFEVQEGMERPYVWDKMRERIA
jgi:hypothetical protein